MAKITDRIYIATMCEDWESVADRYGVGLEMDHFCQAEFMDGDLGSKTLADAKAIAGSRAVKVLHAPFNELFPAAIDHKARALAMDRLNRAAQIALDLGVKKMVVHSGYVPFIYFKEWHVNRSVEFWTEFMADKPADFEICIENVLDDGPEMLVEIAERVDDQRVGLCLDIGHANVVANAGGGRDVGQDEWLRQMAPHLKHMHIHNNDGAGDYHLGFDQGTLDIERLLNMAMDMCKGFTVTAELIEAGASFEWLKDKGFI